MIKAVFALKSFELVYGHQGHFLASQLAGGEWGGAATLEVAEGGGGDACVLKSAISTATLAAKEGIFLIFHLNFRVFVAFLLERSGF